MPSSTDGDPPQNLIFANLPDDELQRLKPHLETVSLRLNETVYQVGDPVRYCYFPESAVLSMLLGLQNGENVQVSIVGREGMAAFPNILGAKWADTLVVAQVSGICIRIPADRARKEFHRCGVFQSNILRYASYLIRELAQTAACNRVHLLEQRFCRWLLIIQDRIHRDRFPITHELLSHILGTPRSEVTLAAGVLRKAGLIEYRRGQIAILDRAGLEKAACECYRVVDAGLS